MATALYKEDDSPLLKEWIITRLENTSDADADVLADYVLALLQHDGDEATIRKLCEVELRPFLSDEDFARFISDVFKALNEKLYLPPGRRPPPLKKTLLSNMYEPSKPLEGSRPNNTPALPQQLNTSRKRSYHDRFEGDSHSSGLVEGQRAYKQPKRGGHGSVQGVYASVDARHLNGLVGGGRLYSLPQPNPPPPLAPGPASLPPRPIQMNDVGPSHLSLPPNPFPMNPEAAHFAPNFIQTSTRQTRNYQGPRKRKNERCRQFDARGACKRGLNCPYEHLPRVSPPRQLLSGPGYPPLPPHLLRVGDPSQIPSAIPAQPDSDLEDGEVSSENPFRPYFPKVHQEPNSDDKGLEIILDALPAFALPPFPTFNPRGGGLSQRGRGGRRGRGRARAQYSLDGPSHDRTLTAIVVESIPEEYFDESNVRQHFSQFGNIVDISMRPYKHLAIVTYDSWAPANAAYRSPQVIFNNRFVKVFWYNEDADKAETMKLDRTENGRGLDGQATEPEEPEFSLEEFIRKQEEAQKIYEEKRQKREELAKQKEELDRRQQDLVAKQLEVRAKLEAKLSQGQSPDGAVNGSPNKSTADALRAQLKKLEAEARILGVDAIRDDEELADGVVPHFSGQRGRGGLRSRGGYRGGYHGSFKGGYGGGAFNDVHEAYAAYTLDNRPKKVAITGVDFTEADKDEKLKHFLLVLGEHDNNVEITPSITQVTFKERRTAESFMNTIKGPGIPGLDGQVDAAWVPNGTLPLLTNGSAAKPLVPASAPAQPPIKNGASVHAEGMPDAPVAEPEEGEVHEQEEPARDHVMDYDVADDEQWGH